MKKDRIIRLTALAILTALVIVLQTVASGIRIGPIPISLTLVPIVVGAVLLGPAAGAGLGAVFGLIAGYFGAMGYPGTGMLFAVLFAVIGFGAGMLAEYLINNSLLPFLVTCLAAFLLTAFCQMFRLWIFHGASFWRLLAVALGQSVLSLPLAIPYYYISRAFHRRRALR